MSIAEDAWPVTFVLSGCDDVVHKWTVFPWKMARLRVQKSSKPACPFSHPLATNHVAGRVRGEMNAVTHKLPVKTPAETPEHRRVPD
jgi:hypothetical protein